MPNVTLHKGSTFTHEGKTYKNGVLSPVSAPVAEYLKSTGRFTDSGAPSPVAAKQNSNRNFVKLSDSVSEDTAEKTLEKTKKEKRALQQKQFDSLLDRFRSELPEFKDVKEIRKYAKEEFGVLLTKVKLLDLREELAFALTEKDFKSDVTAPEKAPAKKQVKV